MWVRWQLTSDFWFKKTTGTGIFLSLIHGFLEQENTSGIGGGGVKRMLLECWILFSSFFLTSCRCKSRPPPYTHTHPHHPLCPQLNQFIVTDWTIVSRGGEGQQKRLKFKVQAGLWGNKGSLYPFSSGATVTTSLNLSLKNSGTFKASQ